MNTPNLGRGERWLSALTGNAVPLAGYPASVRVVDAALAGQAARYLAVLPDPDNHFPRARNGEVGLIEGWQLARAVQEVIAADRSSALKRPIIAVIDVPSQAYGRREEGYGIHQALAGAAGAYAQARLDGHPVIGLIVGKAMSGAFLAHGYQANRLIAFDDAQVMVHAMGKESAARITLRSIEALEALAATVPPMAYDIQNFASLGILWRCLTIPRPDEPTREALDIVQFNLRAALDDILAERARDLTIRLDAPHRQASAKVRDMLREQWTN
ncbi:biotin-independent malonate decarboxylase subunit gamma [Duganella sp. BJB488]|uniref:biotin-independent malonate decarboxylase subunit gamma n=1 Tax=unclassified Duganella TaxID=2636909 RepID=UPI000E342BD7|nr:MULTISPECIES: biotin-independent malonate decarboxylase subunit gamma [unclassified Duganella]RFP13255.1 biotin-independent malonate decarboxylase subunit gamma [Duganella sp. BJB489]RFP17169.1 biotin-independent malonate decarboxylase subunit gamma [Duganella sp. BJB488]RFP31610.1 biotin-independent malonate decarboxylase subunit gamma [Duganella sp. BJB480]